MYYFWRSAHPRGDAFTLGSDGEHLIGLWLRDRSISAEPCGGATRDGLPSFDAARDWLARYFAGEKPMPSELPPVPHRGGVPAAGMEAAMPNTLRRNHDLRSFARALAAQMGRPSMSSQAVGGAVGHNPISIIIPCHRVVGSGGSLTGYAGGIAAKLRLLEHEGVELPACPSPRGARRFEPWQLDSLGRRGPSSTAYFVSRIGRTAGCRRTGAGIEQTSRS